MKTIKEGDLIFDVSSALSYERFDDNKLHGTKSTMKRVDFIIENQKEFIFLEVKDPDEPGASNPEKFVCEFKTGNFVPEVAGQCRDSLLFTKLRKENLKPITYIVLVCMESLDEGLVLNNTDKLIGSLPIKNKNWSKTSVESCVILNLAAYKKRYGKNSVWRASDYK